MGSESIEAVAVSKSSSPSGKFFPPGFRFHPTDEELILYYLKRKICGRAIKLDIIGEVDVYKWDPEELPGQSKWKTGDRQWFFFSPRDRKYPNRGRSNRGTMHGYWKATGKDRAIKSNSRSVGVKKTLVYYYGRAPSGQRTDWVMHEYTLDQNELNRCRSTQGYYVLYKVFKKSGAGPKNGEQYGALFVEEEWAHHDDDNNDYLDVDTLLVQTVKSMGPSHEPLAPSANEPSEVTVVEELQPLVVNEGYLEMDDLIGPQPASRNSEPPVQEDLQVADFDGFCEFDLSPFENRHIQQTYYTDNLEYEMQTSGFHSYLNGPGTEDVDAELQTGYDLWTHDQSSHDFTAAQPTDGGASITHSGFVTSENECRKNGEDDGTGSWVSSALWAFVESVPTTPASALEGGDLVNKAFERMSSFRRMRNRNGAGGAATTTGGSDRSFKGIVYFSVLGVLFAVLCVFVGTSIELLGRCIL